MVSKEAILFIDGNNFYHCVKQMHINPSHIDFLKLSTVVFSRFDLTCKKIIYYNSIPNIADGADKYYAHMRFISELERIPKFETKTRKLQKNSNEEIQEKKIVALKGLKLCTRCSPIIEKCCMDCIGDYEKKEKGIDVMIAVDMIEKALKNEYDYCILFSGDADFIPALKLIEANGKKVKSISVNRGYSSQIRDTFASDYIALNREYLIENCLKEVAKDNY